MNRCIFLITWFCLLPGVSLAAADSRLTCTTLNDEPQQGALLWGKTAPGSKVLLDDEPLDSLPDGTFILGFGRDAPARATLKIIAPDNSGECRQQLTVANRSYAISRVNGVPQKTVTPPEEDLERIRRERELVRQAKSQRFQRADLIHSLIGGMNWPLTGRISGVYGSQRIYNGTPGHPHYGIDIARPTGTPVRAPSGGIITLAEPDLYFAGGTVILDHGYGLSSSFLHLSKILVTVGQEVKAGELIGEVGASGRATGPHLDWRMSWRNRRVDPQLLVPPMPGPSR